MFLRNCAIQAGLPQRYISALINDVDLSREPHERVEQFVSLLNDRNLSVFAEPFKDITTMRLLKLPFIVIVSGSDPSLIETIAQRISLEYDTNYISVPLAVDIALGRNIPKPTNAEEKSIFIRDILRSELKKVLKEGRSTCIFGIDLTLDQFPVSTESIRVFIDTDTESSFQQVRAHILHAISQHLKDVSKDKSDALA